MRPPLLDRLGLGRPDLRAWALYDFANSAFQTTIVAAVFPIYYRKVAAGGQSEALAMSRFAWATALAILIVAIAAPILGAIADRAPIKKRLLGVFLGIGVVTTAAMYWIGPGDWTLALTLFVLGNIGVAGSIVFYESLLPHLVSGDELDRVSAAGYAVGYLGGGLLLAVNLLMIQRPALFGFADAGTATRAAFVTVAVWWLVFAIPLFRRVAEPRVPASARGPQPALAAALRRLATTFRDLRRFRDAFLFLVAFLIYNDGIQTMIRMATIYGTAIGLPEGALITALLMTQFIGIPCAFAFGAIAHRMGARAAVMGGLAVYVVIAVLGYYMTTAAHFFTLAALVGMVQGGTQALSRSLFASMIPRDRSSEFFAFFSVFERYAGVLGPALFALVVERTGSGRSAILAIAGFFLGGAAMLAFVDVRRGRAAARAADGAGLPATGGGTSGPQDARTPR